MPIHIENSMVIIWNYGKITIYGCLKDQDLPDLYRLGKGRVVNYDGTAWLEYEPKLNSVEKIILWL